MNIHLDMTIDRLLLIGLQKHGGRQFLNALSGVHEFSMLILTICRFQGHQEQCMDTPFNPLFGTTC